MKKFIDILSKAIDNLGQVDIDKWFLENDYQLKKGIPLTVERIRPSFLKSYNEVCKEYDKIYDEGIYNITTFSFFCNKTIRVLFKYDKTTNKKTVDLCFLPLKKLKKQ